MEIILRPSVCIPDQDPSLLTTDQLSDALNVQIGLDTPIGGPAVRKTAGNIILTNPLLPPAQNKALAWTADRAKKNLYWINWNSNSSLQTIFHYNEVAGFSIIEQRNFGFTDQSKPTIAFGNNYLAWTSLDVPEPRQYNLQGTYAQPIEEWELFEIQHVPLAPLEVTASTFDVAVDFPKPYPDAPLRGIPFAYNYEFQRQVEGRMSQPTQLYWNPSVVLTLPTSEIYGFLQKNSASNPYIVAIRFYYYDYAQATWVYFYRLKNEGLGPSDYTITVPDTTAISSIGLPSRAALLNADGVARYVKDLGFADNRLLHAYLRTGYNFVFPALPTVEIITSTPTVDEMVARKYRAFPHIHNYKVDQSLLFRDPEGRQIGTQSLGVTVLPRHPQADYQVFLSDQIGTTDFENATWTEVVNFPGGGTPYDLNSTIDAVASRVIQITPPTGVIDPNVATVELITRSHITVTNYNRTLCRPFFVYGSPEAGFKIFFAYGAESYVIDSVQYSWYGLGFMFDSGEGIGFSTEQNLYIEVIGQTVPDVPSLEPDVAPYVFPFPDAGPTPYKITDILGSMLISKQDYAAPTGGAEEVFFSSAYFDLDSGYGHKGFTSSILDIVLYSKVETPTTQWNTVPNVIWTAAEYIAGTPKTYYGDSFFTADEKSFSSYRNTPVYQGGADLIQEVDFTLGVIRWQGYFTSMNLNGIFLETWDSDTGSATVLNADPKETDLTNAVRHSEQFIPNTGVNGMFAFDPLNEKQTANQLGSITKLITLAVNNDSGANAYVVHQAGVQMIFLGRTQQTATNGDSVMSLNTKVFGSDNVLQIDYGAQEKDQVVMTNMGLAAFWDEINNALVQISSNGLDPISLQREFQSQAQDILDGAIIGYNPLWKEFVVQAQGQGLAYNFSKDRYQGRRTFGDEFPELFAWLSSSKQSQAMYGFYNGELYLFNQGDTLAGETFECSMTFRINEAKDVLKKAKAIWQLCGNEAWTAELTTDTGLITDIQEGEFEKREGMFYQSVKQASNTVGGKWDGADIHGFLYELKLSGIGLTAKTLTFVRAIFSPSPTTQN